MNENFIPEFKLLNKERNEFLNRHSEPENWKILKNIKNGLGYKNSSSRNPQTLYKNCASKIIPQSKCAKNDSELKGAKHRALDKVKLMFFVVEKGLD